MWAHSRNDSGQRHGLTEHLRSTAALARRFAEPFGAGELAAGLGLLHDAGKAACTWQDKLLQVEDTGAAVGIDHKSLGARLLVPVAGQAAMAVLGHHGGLTDPEELRRSVTADPRSDEQDTLNRLLAQVPEARDLLGGPPLLPAEWRRDRLLVEIGLRLTFSALVDADHLDTTSHFRNLPGPVVAEAADMVALVQRFEEQRRRLLADRLPSPVDGLRGELYDAAVRAAAGPTGLYRLPAPTGSGKTMTGAAFALHHAARYGKARVIVAVPFITITEQNAGVYRDLLGPECVVEHHSNVEFEGRAARLGAENWDAPFVVTTTVQLFDSLFGRMPSRSRKLHRLANAVVVLDEVQALPVPLLVPILDGLRLLAEHFGTTVLLTSATQPAFQHLEVWSGRRITDIVDDPARLYEQLRRVRYEWRLDPQPTLAEVADEVATHRQALIVVNTVRDARTLYRLLVERTGEQVRHLSTRMCPAHRRAVLDETRALLAVDEPVLLVSTQLIEAGVDVDFPVVFRALAPADSLQQAAGRANREGRRPEPGRVVVFAASDASAPPAYRAPVEATKPLFGPALADPDDLHALERYYRRLYSSLNLDEGERGTKIQEARLALDFRAVAEGPLIDASEPGRNHRLAFRMIDDDTTPVVVTDYGVAGEVPELLDQLRAASGPRREVFRALQQFTVTLPNRVVTQPAVAAMCQPVWPVVRDLLEWRGCYHEQLGIDEDEIGKETVW